MAQAEQPRWLTEEEMLAWRGLVGVIIWLPAALDAQLQRDAGLTHFEYGVLAALSEAPGRTMRMSDLADLAFASLSKLSRGVDRLDQRGWVRRAPDPHDGRATQATLTDAGWDKIRESALGHVEAVRALVFDNLTRAQVRQLSEIGRRVLAAVKPDGCTPAS